MDILRAFQKIYSQQNQQQIPHTEHPGSTITSLLPQETKTDSSFKRDNTCIREEDKSMSQLPNISTKITNTTTQNEVVKYNGWTTLIKVAESWQIEDEQINLSMTSSTEFLDYNDTGREIFRDVGFYKVRQYSFD